MAAGDEKGHNMFKVVKIIVLLAVLACVAVAVYMFTQTARDDNIQGPGEISSSEDEQAGIRVEEKYGFTSEGVGP